MLQTTMQAKYGMGRKDKMTLQGRGHYQRHFSGAIKSQLAVYHTLVNGHR